MRNIKKIYDLLGLIQVALFFPFFLFSGFFIFQLVEDYLILTHYNEYKADFLVVTNKQLDDGNTGYGGYTLTYSVGIINETKILLDEDQVRRFISKRDIKIHDTIYVWYRNDIKETLPRLKSETKIKLSRYLHPQFRYLMLFGIPPFIILTIILRRIKKKNITDEKK